MHRQNINTMTANERLQLARLIRRYATPAVVNRHWEAVRAGAHNSPTRFLAFHRNYLAGLENHLAALRYPQWVPLPAWNPAEPIPEEFNIPNTGRWRLVNLNPGISFSPQFDQANLGNFKTEEDLGRALMGPHNRVHRAISGIMNNLRRAPEAPIFWPWHSFIDDIWRHWQRLFIWRRHYHF